MEALLDAPPDSLLAQSRGYALGDLLGRGRLGRVLAARHLRSSRELALRVFAPALSARGPLRRALWRALRGALALDHPRLLGVLELGESREGVVWAAMERGAPWTPPRDDQAAGRDLDDLLQGLAHVHAQHRWHGDIRAGHLYRDAAGRLVLADTGLVAVCAPEDRPTELGALGGGALAWERAQAADMGDVAVLTQNWPLSAADRSRVTGRARASLRPVERAPGAGPSPGARPAGAAVPPRATFPPPATHPPPAGAGPGLRQTRGPERAAHGPLWPWRALHADAQPLPFVGREAERKALASGVERVLQGDGARLVLLEGGPGLGRARLCQWTVTTAASSGRVRWMWGWHGPNGGWGQGIAGMVARHLGVEGLDARLARGPLRALLRSPARFDGGPGAADQLVDWLLPAAQTAPLGPLDVWRAVLGVLRAECRDGALVLVLEEGWWSPWTLGFVQHLLEQAPELPVLVLLTVRADRIERRPQAAALLDALASRPETGRVRLAPMGREELARLLRDGLSLGPVLAERVATRSRGIPLEVVELVRDLDQADRLVAGPDGWEERQPSAPLPPTLDALWQGRVARVPGLREGWVEALATAAVLGGSASDPHWVELAASSGAPDPALLLHRARRAGVVGGGSVADPDGLRLRHGSLVPALVRLARRRGTLDQLHARCVDLGVAPVRSAAHLRHLLGAHRRDEVRARSGPALASCLHRSDANGGAELLRLVVGAWRDRRGGGAGADSTETARQSAMFDVFSAHLEELRGERSRTAALRVLSGAQRQHWHGVALQAHLLLGWIALREGESEQVHGHGRAAEGLARRAGDERGLQRAWLLLGWRALLGGQETELEEYLRLLRDRGSREAVALELRGRACLGGEVSSALLAAIQAALGRARGAGAWGELVLLHGLRADVWRRRQMPGPARAEFEEAMLWERALGMRCWWPPALGLGLLEQEHGDPRTAAHMLEDCLGPLELRGPPVLAALAHLGLAVVAAGRAMPAALFHTRQAAGLLRVGGGRSPDVLPLLDAISVSDGTALAELVGRLRQLQQPGR